MGYSSVLCVYLLCQYVVVGEECRPVVSVCGMQWWLSGSVEDTPEHHILPVNDTYMYMYKLLCRVSAICIVGLSIQLLAEGRIY